MGRTAVTRNWKKIIWKGLTSKNAGSITTTIRCTGHGQFKLPSFYIKHSSGFPISLCFMESCSSFPIGLYRTSPIKNSFCTPKHIHPILTEFLPGSGFTLRRERWKQSPKAQRTRRIERRWSRGSQTSSKRKAEVLVTEGDDNQCMLIK